MAVHGFPQSVAALPGAQQVPGWGKQPSGKQPTLWGSEMWRAGHGIEGTCASPSEATAPAGSCAWFWQFCTALVGLEIAARDLRSVNLHPIRRTITQPLVFNHCGHQLTSCADSSNGLKKPPRRA